MTPKLKPCPRCRSKQIRVYSGGTKYFIVECRYCNFQTAVKETRIEAIRAWNAAPLRKEKKK